MAHLRGGKGGSSPEQELADLQRKYALLEGDRKAYYETSQWTIKQNRETLAACKVEGKELHDELVKRNSQKAAGYSDAAELVRLTAYVTELKRRHDDMKQLAARKETALQSRVDSVKDLELDAVKLSEGDTPVTQHLRALEARMQATQQRHEETLAHRKTLEQIAKRLRDERVGLQNQLHSLERNLNAKTADLEELIRVSHDAAHAKEAAKAELAAVEEQLSNECGKREKELADRHALWRLKQDLAAAAEQANAAHASEPKPVEQDAPTRRGSAVSVFPDGGRASDSDGAMSFEAALRKIKEATGVSEVDDVIKKFSAQKETAKNLAAMTLEAQTRIDSLTARIEAAKVEAESLKYTGAAPVGGSRRVLDELEAQLADATARHERLHARQERVAKLLVALRAGAEHLAERLERVQVEGDAAAGARRDDVDATLQLCQLKLAHMLRELDGDAAAAQTALADPARLAAMAFPAAGEPSQVVLRRETQRMDALGISDEEEDDEAAEDEDGEGTDEVLDRSAVKSTAERHLGVAKKLKSKGSLAGGHSASLAGRKPGSVGAASRGRG